MCGWNVRCLRCLHVHMVATSHVCSLNIWNVASATELQVLMLLDLNLAHCPYTASLVTWGFFFFVTAYDLSVNKSTENLSVHKFFEVFCFFIDIFFMMLVFLSLLLFLSHCPEQLAFPDIFCPCCFSFCKSYSLVSRPTCPFCLLGMFQYDVP